MKPPIPELNRLRVHFSSNSDEWRTPPDLFAALDKEFVFTLDPAATKENALCREYFTKETNGLKQPWTSQRVFVNPPYSHASLWIEKAAVESRRCPVIVMLLPARTDTKAFHKFIWAAGDHTHGPRRGVQIRFIKGRLKFSGHDSPAPFPSMLVIWRCGDPKNEW